MVKHVRLWIVIADGEHARLVKPRQEDLVLQTQERFDSKSARLRSADLETDRPGRVHESATVARHAAEPRTDPHEAAKADFAKRLGEWLTQSARENAFDELVVVAPSHTKAAIEGALDNIAQQRLRGSLAKDLTKVPDDELQPHLAEWVPPPRRAR